MRIFRYELEITDRQTLQLPLGYKLLSVAPGRNPDRDKLHYIDLWVQVPEVAPDVPVEFQVVGTGNPMPDARLEFIGTCATHDGLGVWHVFERPNPMQKTYRREL